MVGFKIKNSHTQAGNVLIFILIAVILFGALTYAFTETTSDTGVSTLERSQNRTRASQVIDYASDIKQAISQMKLLNDCEPTDISFHSTNVPSSSDYKHSPDASEKCKVFHNAGGDMSYSQPREDWLVTSNEGSFGYQEWIFAQKAHKGVGSSTNELTMHIRYLKKDLCARLNNELGVDNSGGDPPSTGDVSPETLYKGQDFDSPGTAHGEEGVKTACVDEGTNEYTFYKVLIAQ